MTKTESTGDFSDFEAEAIKEIQASKIIWLGDKNLPFKKRLYQFIATLITVLLRNFTTKRNWQVGLFLYFLITVPVGTIVSVKSILRFILNLF